MSTNRQLDLCVASIGDVPFREGLPVLAARYAVAGMDQRAEDAYRVGARGS